MPPRTLAVPLGIALLASVAACDKDEPDQRARSFFMGFSAIPPSNDPALQLPTLDMAAAHSDAGLIQLSIPWNTLVGGTSAPDEVRAVRLPLVQYYRGGGRVIVVALDVTNCRGHDGEAHGQRSSGSRLGKLQGGPYVGIAQDRSDFPFLDALGLSSYPYQQAYDRVQVGERHGSLAS